MTLLISSGAKLVAGAVGGRPAAGRSPRAQLRDAGLIPNIEQRDSDEPEGQVIAQDPAGGEHGEEAHRPSRSSSRPEPARRSCRTSSGESKDAGEGRPEGRRAQRPDRQADDHRPERGRPGARPIPDRRHAPSPRRVRDRLRRQVHRAAADHHHADHDDARRPDAGGGAERRALERARGLAPLGRLGGRGPAGGGPRGDSGPARARRALDARRRGDRAAGRGRPARRRGRLPGAARPVRRGRHGAGPARVPGPPLRRARRARRRGGDRQADLQAGARLPRHSPGGRSARRARTAGASRRRPWACRCG